MKLSIDHKELVQEKQDTLKENRKKEIIKLSDRRRTEWINNTKRGFNWKDNTTNDLISIN